jgi:hypothetical protein
MTEEEEKGTRYRGQIIRSGEHDGIVVTREAVEGMLEQLEESPKPTYFEHDPTVPPIGRVKNGRLVEIDGGEVALETEMELFEGRTVPAVLKPARELREQIDALPGWPTEEGPLEITVDARSYTQEDVQELRDIAADVGDADAFDNAMRFSELPDAFLVFGLVNATIAAGWFFKGFFTKAGEGPGEEVGKDLARAYRRFKDKALDTVEHREPADRPPVTMITFTLERPGGGTVEIEGSSRATGAGLEAFLDAGSQLLPIAHVYLRAAPEPERVAKMHFAHTEQGWNFVYGLDTEALPVMVVALSDEEYAAALTQAESEAKAATQPGASSEGPGRGADAGA